MSKNLTTEKYRAKPGKKQAKCIECTARWPNNTPRSPSPQCPARLLLAPMCPACLPLAPQRLPACAPCAPQRRAPASQCRTARPALVPARLHLRPAPAQRPCLRPLGHSTNLGSIPPNSASKNNFFFSLLLFFPLILNI